MELFDNAKPLRAIEYHSFRAFDVIVIHAYEADDGSADSACNRAHWLGAPYVHPGASDRGQPGRLMAGLNWRRMDVALRGERTHVPSSVHHVCDFCHLLDVLYIFNQIRSKVLLVNARIYEPLIRI